MNIVLIGAGGFLGTHILTDLSKVNEYQWQLLTSSGAASISANFTCHPYTWPKQSLANDTYTDVFGKADVIIYAAGAGIQPGENVQEEQITALNLLEPVRLSQQLVQLSFKGQLITFGSYFETGKNQSHSLLNEELFLEQCNELPNIYCRSKKELTHYHAVAEKAGLPFKWLHLVLTNIYGPGENKKRLIPYIIEESKQNNPLHFTSGSQIRQYTFIGDVVAVVKDLLGKASGLYHLTNEEIIMVKQIIEETLQQVKDKLQLAPQFQFDIAERRDTSMDYLAISAQKLKNDWGLECSTSFQEGIARYFNDGNYQ